MDHPGEKEFCGTSLTDPCQDFAFGKTILLNIPVEATTKKDWRGTALPSISELAPSLSKPPNLHIILIFWLKHITSIQLTPAFPNIVLSFAGHNIDFNMLMSTEEGNPIPGEVILNIIEKVVHLEPTVVRSLSLVSKVC